LTPSGIEPAIFRFVVQCLNHYATACSIPIYYIHDYSKQNGNVSLKYKDHCYRLLGYSSCITDVGFSCFVFQIDSDLVFDDGAGNNEYMTHADQRKSSSNVRRHSNSSRHQKDTNVYHEPSTSDHQIVAPVQSPVEDTEEENPDSSKGSDTSFFGRISEFGKRAKRQWTFNLFGNDEEPENKDPLSVTEGKGFLGLDSGNLFDWFSGSDRRNEKYESHTSEAASSSTSESESGETPQVTTAHDGRYRIKRDTRGDDITGEVDVEALDPDVKEDDTSNGGDVESSTNHVQVEEDDESEADAAAGHRQDEEERIGDDDEDYIDEGASGSGMDGRTAPPTQAAPPPDRQPSEYCINPQMISI
jgi:hypothetical protein